MKNLKFSKSKGMHIDGTQIHIFEEKKIMAEGDVLEENSENNN